MMHRITRFARMLAGIGFGLTLLACTDEDPTGIGGALLPAGDVETFEVILEPAQFLQFDTAFSGYAAAIDFASYQVMRRFEGVVDANALFRYGALPTSLQVRDASGTVRADTLVRFPSGYLLLLVDTIRSRGTGTFGVYRTAEEFDSRTATWTVRSDTGGVRRLWQTPGGTRGPLIGSVAWTSSMDSVTIPLDSAMIVVLTDTAVKSRGALITLDLASVPTGASLRLTSASLRLSGKSTIRPDTTVVVTLGPEASTFVFTPDPPTLSGAAAVSGVPAWRTAIGLREDLKNLMVPCPGTGCTVRLSQAHINMAELLLRPTGSPAGFSPEDSIFVGAQTLLESPNVPLSRSPIGEAVGSIRQAIPRSRFSDADTGPEVALPITVLLTAIASDTATTAQGRIPRRLALLTSPQSATFGLASFRAGPRLRVVLTISTER